MGRDDKARKKERKKRNKDLEALRRASHNDPNEPGRDRYRDGFRFGKHPDAVCRPEWSGVRIPVDLADPAHMDGIVELTELALADPKPKEAN